MSVVDIRELRQSARYEDPHTFSMEMVPLAKGREYLYQEMAEEAAVTGNLPVMQWISGVYMVDWNSVAVIARTYGHYRVAEYVSGNSLVPNDIDIPSVEDLQEDRSSQAQYWQNSGGFVTIKVDTPIEGIDVTRKRKIMGKRKWGWRGDDLDVPETTNTWVIRP